MQKALVPGLYCCQLLRRQMRLSTGIALFTGCGGARQHNIVVDQAVGELIVRLVETRAGIIEHSTDMFQLAKHFALRSRCGGCRRIDGAAEVRVTFLSTVAIRSVQNPANVSSLRGSFTSSSQRYHVLLSEHRPSWQPEGQLIVICVAGRAPLFQPAAWDSACQSLCCRSFSAPDMTSLQVDADATILHARLRGSFVAASADSLSLSLLVRVTGAPWCQSS